MTVLDCQWCRTKNWWELTYWQCMRRIRFVQLVNESHFHCGARWHGISCLPSSFCFQTHREFGWFSLQLSPKHVQCCRGDSWKKKKKNLQKVLKLLGWKWTFPRRTSTNTCCCFCLMIHHVNISFLVGSGWSSGGEGSNKTYQRDKTTENTEF